MIKMNNMKKVMMMGLALWAVGAMAQDVRSELKAIEAAYAGLDGLSGRTVVRLHELKADGSAGALLEETTGQMVWTHTLKYEAMDGVERYTVPGQLVLVDREDHTVLVQALPQEVLSDPLPA